MEPENSAASEYKLEAWFKIFLHSNITLLPTVLRIKPLACWRINNWVCNSDSICAIAAEIDGEDTCIFSEAIMMLPHSAVATKYSICLKEIRFNTLDTPPLYTLEKFIHFLEHHSCEH